MNIRVLDEAEAELIEAALWYESRESGLGWRFPDDVAHVLARIAQGPVLWRERVQVRNRWMR